MSFGSTNNIPSTNPSLLGAQTNLASTNQQARPLPWFAGTRWLAPTWISDAFGEKTTEVRQNVGKSSQVTGYNYYASFAALFCNGPVDRITCIRMDDGIVWQGVVNRGAEDFVDIMVVSRGRLRVYWGTETQGFDPVLKASGQPYAGYRGQFWILGDTILFNGQSAPNIIVQISRAAVPPFFVGHLSNAGQFTANYGIIAPGNYGIQIPYNANPIAVLWEWLTDKRFGIGIDPSELDIPSLQAAALTLAGELMGVNPYLDTESDMKSQLITLFEHFDMYPTSPGGKFGVALVRAVADPVPELDKTGFTGDPSFDGQQWPDTFNITRLTFKDDELVGQDNAATVREQANFAITGRAKSQTIDRPWVTVFSVAFRMASCAMRIASLPQVSGGNFTARESTVVGIQVGTVFNLSTRDGELIRCRCTERHEPPHDSRAVGITFEPDRGWANQTFFSLTPAARPIKPVLAPHQIVVAVMDAPFAFSADHSLPATLFFAARGDLYTTGFDIWRSIDDLTFASAAAAFHSGTLYRSFAVKAQLLNEYPATTTKIDDVLGLYFEVVSADAGLLDGEWDLAAGLNQDLLGFFGDDATEIMSLFDVFRNGPGYTAHVVRGLYDTLRRTHPVGTTIWIQLRTKIISETWTPFSSSTRYYKFQPKFGNAQIELGDITSIVHSANSRTTLPLPPSDLQADGDGVFPTWDFGGSDVVLTWEDTNRVRTVFGMPLSEVLPGELDHVLLDIFDRDGLIRIDFPTVPSTGNTATLSNVYLQNIISGDFLIRAYGIRSGMKSLDYTSLLVTRSGPHVVIRSGIVTLQSDDGHWYAVRVRLIDGQYRVAPDQVASAPLTGELPAAPITLFLSSLIYKFGLKTIEGIVTVFVDQTPTLDSPVIVQPLTCQDDGTNHRLFLELVDGIVTYKLLTF